MQTELHQWVRSSEPALNMRPAGDDVQQLYGVYCLDKPGATELRASTREAHLEWLRESGRVVMGGPLLENPRPDSALEAAVQAAEEQAAAEQARREAESQAEAEAMDGDEVDPDLFAKAALRETEEEMSESASTLETEVVEADLVGVGDRVGTLLLVNGDDLDEVRDWVATDPYNRAGLFTSTTVAPLTTYHVDIAADQPR